MVTYNLSLPRFQASTPLVETSGTPTTAFHTWWATFAANLETNFNGLSSTVQQLSDLNNDNLLTPAKKPIWILLYSNITSEQSNIDTQATLYSITTEKTNYDNAVTALTTYLGTLTTPVLWNDLTGNTTIVGTTFRTDFNNVFSTKQILLDKMHSLANSLAAAAQTTANTGVTNAATAQTTANTGVTNAATAQTTADVVKINDAISSSWPVNGSSFAVLSATDAGTNVTITVVTHTRNYGDITNVSVTGASITGLAYTTDYYVYYDDPTRVGGGVTYHATTNPVTASYNEASGRHFCGGITTPASGGAPTSGGASSAGTFCVTADSLILMTDNREKLAGEVVVGDEVWTCHEVTGEQGLFKVVGIVLAEEPIMSASSYPDATAEHRFADDSKQWFQMKDIGQPAGIATVVKLTVEDAHTYMARHPSKDSPWRLCHNIKVVQ